jgi:hypothetical protein
VIENKRLLAKSIVLAEIREREGTSAAEAVLNIPSQFEDAVHRVVAALTNDVTKALRKATDSFDVMQYQAVVDLCADALTDLENLREIQRGITGSPDYPPDAELVLRELKTGIDKVRERNEARKPAPH